MFKAFKIQQKSLINMAMQSWFMADHYPSGSHGEDLISHLIETNPQSEGVTTGKLLYQFTWIFLSLLSSKHFQRFSGLL